MTETRHHVTASGVRVEITRADERPKELYITRTAATTTSGTGEKIEIAAAIANPFLFFLNGEKFRAKVDFQPVIQEALLHVLRENDIEPANSAYSAAYALADRAAVTAYRGDLRGMSLAEMKRQMDDVSQTIDTETPWQEALAAAMRCPGADVEGAVFDPDTMHFQRESDR